MLTFTASSSQTKDCDKLRFLRLQGTFPVREKRGADFTNSAITAAGGAMFTTIKNDLEVQFIPSAHGKEALQITLSLSDIFTVRELPTLG